MFHPNPQLLVDELPSLENIHFQKVDPRSMTISTIQTALFFGIVLVASVVAIFFIDKEILTNVWFFAGAGFWILLFVWVYFFIKKEYDAMAYALRQNDLIYRSGVYYKDEIVIPFNRIQHCEISQGPISRRYGLFNLTAYTAGSDGEIEISGLEESTAQRLKQFITQQIVVDEEE